MGSPAQQGASFLAWLLGPQAWGLLPLCPSLSCCPPATWLSMVACAPWPPLTGRSCNATSSPAGGCWGVPGVPGRQGGGGRQGSSEQSGACSSFKLFLELEPQVRDIIFKFYESKYASCLKMLDEMKVRAAQLEGRGAGPGCWP